MADNKELRRIIRSRVGIITSFDVITAVGANGKLLVGGREADEYDYEETASWSDLTAVSYAGQIVGLKKDGTVVACGEYEGGECDVGDLRDIKKVFAAYGATYGINKDGKAVVCGSSVYADLIWKEVIWKEVKDIFCKGSEEIAFLLPDGRVILYGYVEGYARSGLDYSDWKDIVKVVPEYDHTVALKKDGTVVACGDNSQGECKVEWWKDIVDIAASHMYIQESGLRLRSTYGITADGRVVACGNNSYGQCNVSDWTDIVSIACSGKHTVGLRSNGTVVACGDNSSGQCDVRNWYDIVEVFCGSNATIGVRKDGLLVFAGKGFEDCVGWRIFDNIESLAGDDPSYELKFEDRNGSVYVRLVESTNRIDESEKQKNIEVITAKRAELKLNTHGLASVGMEHLAACKSDGTLLSKGNGTVGQRETDNWEDVVSVSCGPTHTIGVLSNGNVLMCGASLTGDFKVDNWGDIIEVAGSGYHAVGLHSFGHVSACGDNSKGQCNVGAWRNIVAIACGNTYTAGLKTDGTVVICGDTGRVSAAEEWTDIVSISGGENHLVGLRSNGTVVACGNNMDGRCNTSEWQNIVSVACGAKHTVAVKADGTVVACGSNDDGRSNVSDWSNVKLVYSGTYAATTVAVKESGEVLTCGAIKGDQYGAWKLFENLDNIEEERKAAAAQRIAIIEEERARMEAERLAAEEENARIEAERKAKLEEEQREKELRRKADREAAAKKERTSKIIKSIIALCVAAGIAVGAYFLYSRWKAQEEAKRAEEAARNAEQYDAAVSYEASGEYADAYREFIALGDYEDSAARAEKLISEHMYLKYANVNVGDIITFGKYEQDNNWDNGYDDIDWIVLENTDDKLLLMSKYALDCKPYHTQNTMVDWNGSYLRSWLNSNFYNGAFSEDEKKAIVLTDHVTIDNDDYGVPGGYDTQDYVFLLNLNQIRGNGYFSSASSRTCVPSEYAKSLGAYVNGTGNSWWWLCTPGEYLSNAAGVNAEGEISSSGDPVNIKDNVVRPVIWLNIEA